MPAALQRMFRGDEGLFDEAFMYGCPKFITAAPPAYDNPSAAGPQEVSTEAQEGMDCSMHCLQTAQIDAVVGISMHTPAYDNPSAAGPQEVSTEASAAGLQCSESCIRG